MYRIEPCSHPFRRVLCLASHWVFSGSLAPFGVVSVPSDIFSWNSGSRPKACGPSKLFASSSSFLSLFSKSSISWLLIRRMDLEEREILGTEKSFANKWKKLEGEGATKEEKEIRVFGSFFFSGMRRMFLGNFCLVPVLSLFFFLWKEHIGANNQWVCRFIPSQKLLYRRLESAWEICPEISLSYIPKNVPSNREKGHGPKIRMRGWRTAICPCACFMARS